MTDAKAEAYPRKRFFLEMFTRDITLIDSILDLADNSIDALVRREEIDVSESLLYVEKNGNQNSKNPESNNSFIGQVKIQLSSESFVIADNSGGITRQEAEKEIFRFGAPESPRGKLGVYGVGLKRAIFKIGRQIRIVSRTENEGFSIDIDLDAWEQEEEDWTFPLTYISGAGSRRAAGTRIEITRLRPEILLRIESGSLEKRLVDRIQTTYGLFLGKHVEISVNSRKLKPHPIPFGESEEIVPAIDRVEREVDGGLVKVTLVAGLAMRTWKADVAGWYALCHGRIVVAANKHALTGWGDGMSSFQPKYRGFVGAAFYFSDNPYTLPWTTTKHGLNQEASVYQETKKRMEAVSGPVLRFLDRYYPSSSGDQGRPEIRSVSDGIKAVDIRKVAATGNQSQFIATPARKLKTTVRIQYDAEETDIEMIRRNLGKRNLSAARVGEHTFKYYLEMECGKAK